MPPRADSLDALFDRLPDADLSRRQFRLSTLVLAVLAAATVFLVATEAFPYHSTNHDEGVYLQQAAMLLDGQLYLRPPVEGAMRPWFFVDAESPAGPAKTVPEVAGDVLYAKYAPVPAAVFALGLAVDLPRLSLALVGAGIVALSTAVVAEAFDRKHGVVAGALVLASPLFVVNTATFLPYAPTALLNLAFAWAYLRADRAGDGAGRWATLAGLAIGAAFFARPYTALLFALPFVVHALWMLRGDDLVGRLDANTLARQSLVAAGGLVGVIAALGYNWVVTGDPLVFPYAAFAPHDGLGFGRRAILGYERVYDLPLALEANARVLAALFGRWVVAGPLGSLLAFAGLVAAFRPAVARRTLTELDPRRLVLAGLFASIPLGNVAFWGNLNVLGELTRAGDGLIHFLGPYYHYDLLLPVAAFGAHAALVAVGRTRHVVADRSSPAVARVAVAVLLIASAVFGGVAVDAVADPVAENANVGDQLTQAYEPVVERDLQGAVVFLPTPYGDWLNHPFQALRNDPGFGEGGEPVYALRERQFDVVDAYPDRELYRYTYRGQWAPFLGDAVDAHLQPVTHVRGERVTLDAAVGVPPGVESVSIRLAAEDDAAYYGVTDTEGEVPLSVVIEDGTARVAGPVESVGADGVPVAGRTDLQMTVFLDYGGAQALSYRFTLPVERVGGEVRALSPYVEVCRDVRLCGGEAAYVPGAHREGISVETALRSSDA